MMKFKMVDYSIIRDGIAFLQVSNPPVNALSCGVRRGIEKSIEQAALDQSVKAVVLAGKGSFIAGADIREFSSGEYMNSPVLVELCNLIEASPKPVVAAINGFALGGGHEVAISCHYRVAHEKAQFGFPEVDIGLLPGATGTQRFPRLAGLKAALDLLPTGKRIKAAEAKALGVVDEVVCGDVVEEAISFAKSIQNRSLDGRRTSQREVQGKEDAEALRDAAIKLANKKRSGMLAPINCIRAIMASTRCSFEEGLAIEKEEMMSLFFSGQSKALQYAFFAQRAAPKWERPGGLSFKTAKGRPIKKAAVIGAGTMGTGIAVSILNGGLPVTLVEQNQQYLDKGIKEIKKLYSGSVALGRMSEKQAIAAFSRLSSAVDYKALSDVDLVIEAVYENMNLKKKIFADLDKVCPPNAFLWTNTSGLDIDEIASVTKRPELVLGAHFFAPAYHMKLLENCVGKHTAPETIASAQQFGLRVGKIPIVVGNCSGFVGNRMLGPYALEASFLVEEGCMPEDVDQVVENFGFPMGIFKVMDLSGIDIGVLRHIERAKSLGVELTSDSLSLEGERTSGLAKALYDLGHYGRKTGRGYYNYNKPGGKVPIVDDFIKDFIVQYRASKGMKARRIPYHEIEERLYLGLINEGFKTLEAGIATKPEDIDTIWMVGYGWPRYTGGPMYYANTIGLKRVYDRICHYQEAHPRSFHWKPSKLLQKLASGKVPMKEWVKVAQSSSRL